MANIKLKILMETSTKRRADDTVVHTYLTVSQESQIAYVFVTDGLASKMNKDDYIVLTDCRVATKDDVIFVNAQHTTKVTC